MRIKQWHLTFIISEPDGPMSQKVSTVDRLEHLLKYCDDNKKEYEIEYHKVAKVTAVEAFEIL